MFRPTAQILSTDETRGGRKANLSVAIINDLESMAPMASAWNGLVEEDLDTSPFNRFGWYEAWCRTFLETGRLHALTVHENGVLIGGLWLCRETRLGTDFLKLAGEAWAGGDYLDLVARPEERDLVAFALAVTLKESSDWKVLDLNGLAERSPLLRALQEVAGPEGWAVEVTTADICPRIDRCSIQEWENAPDRVFKRIVAKSEKQTANKVTIELEDSFDLAADQAARWIGELTEWSVANWRRRGEISCFENPLMIDFYGLQAAAITDGSGPAMHRLLVDGEPAAVVFGLWKGPDFYFLQSGISPLGQAHRAGNLLLNRMIRRCLEQGGRFFFLRGDEVYKYRWGARDTRTHRLIVSRSTTWFALRDLWGSIKVPLKNVRDVLRKARAEGWKSTMAEGVDGLKARLHQSWELSVFRIRNADDQHETLSELTRVKKLKKISCGPLDESDLIQIRLGRGQDIEKVYRARHGTSRGYCAYQGGNLVASVWITERSGTVSSGCGRPGLEVKLPEGDRVIYDLWSAPGIEAGPTAKLLAFILDTEKAGISWLAIEPGVLASFLDEVGIRSVGTLEARRTLGRVSSSSSSSDIPVRFGS